MTTSIQDILGAPAAAATQQKPRNRLDQEQFFDLLTTQLRNQDPLKPMQSAEFFGQLAQFSTVAGINDLQNSFSQFAASMQSQQALQASTLVGRAVLAPTDIGALRAGATLTGVIDLPADAGQVRVGVYDQNGQLVRSLDLGAQASGSREFAWDGIRDDGAMAAPGLYRVRAEAVVDNNAQALPTSMWNTVDSVTLGAAGGGLLLNIPGVGSVPLSSINQVR